MRNEDEFNRDGVIYVSRREFARRMGVSENTIRNRVAEGKLSEVSFGKDMKKWLNWEVAKTMFAIYPKNTNGRKSKPQIPKEQKDTKTVPFHKPNEKVSTPKVTQPTVSLPSVDMPEPPEIEDMSSFDKNVYSDCLDDMGEFDYDKLKVRLTSEAYKLKQDKDRGLLVEKTEVVTFARKLGIILNNGLESVPQRYTSILLAKCQTIIASRLGIPDFEFTEEERVELRAALKSVGPEIMKSLKLVIEEMTEEDE